MFGKKSPPKPTEVIFAPNPSIQYPTINFNPAPEGSALALLQDTINSALKGILALSHTLRVEHIAMLQIGQHTLDQLAAEGIVSKDAPKLPVRDLPLAFDVPNVTIDGVPHPLTLRVWPDQPGRIGVSEGVPLLTDGRSYTYVEGADRYFL